MKDIEDKLNAFLAASKQTTKTSSSLDERILSKALELQNNTRTTLSTSSASRWSRIMKQKQTWISAVAALIVIGLALTFLHQTTPMAYAIAQTLEAMKSVHTVSFKAFLYKQQTEISCQMRLSDKAAKPTHIRLYWEGHPNSKIDNEKGSFAYNSLTNRFRRNRRDERKFNWYPDFRQIFNQALADAEYNEAIKIGRETDSKTQQELITIDIPGKHRDVRYWIDPETKLPLRFTTTKTHNLKQLRRHTIAAREIWDIRYNEDVPHDVFSIPTDAEEVTEEIDTIVHPGKGIPVGDMTEGEACLELINQTQAALNALDFETATQLMFPMGVPPQEVIEQIKVLKAQTVAPLVELLSHEEPYEEGAYWYVRCRVKHIDKAEAQEDLIRIRFFEFDGVRSCMIAMPD